MNEPINNPLPDAQPPQAAMAQGFVFPKASEILNHSWGLFKSRYKTLVYISLAPISAVFLGGLVAGVLAAMQKDHNLAFTLFICGLILLFIFLSLWGFCALIHNVMDEQQDIGFRESYTRSSHDIWPLILAGLLTGLAVFGGMLLLIVPGIIFGFWFSQTYYVVISEKLGAVEAMKKSKAYVQGNIKHIFLKGLYIGFIGAIIGIIISIIFGTLDKILKITLLYPITNLAFQILWYPLATVYAYKVFTYLKASKS